MVTFFWHDFFYWNGELILIYTMNKHESKNMGSLKISDSKVFSQDLTC